MNQTLLEQAESEIKALYAKKIFAALQKQAFFDWYNGEFERFITGDLEHEEQIARSTAETLMIQ